MKRIISKIMRLGLVLLIANCFLSFLFAYLTSLTEKYIFFSIALVGFQIVLSIVVYYLFQRLSIKRIDPLIRFKMIGNVVINYIIILSSAMLIMFVLTKASPLLDNLKSMRLLYNSISFSAMFIYSIIAWIVFIFIQNLLVTERLKPVIIKNVILLIKNNYKKVLFFYFLKTLILLSFALISKILNQTIITNVAMRMSVVLVDTLIQICFFIINIQVIENNKDKNLTIAST